MSDSLSRRRRAQHYPSHCNPRLSHHEPQARPPPHEEPPSSYSTSSERHSTSRSSSLHDSNDRGSPSRGMPNDWTSDASTGSSRTLTRQKNKSIVECCRLELEGGDAAGKSELKELRECVARIRRELRRGAKTKEKGKGKEKGMKENGEVEQWATWSCPLSPSASTSAGAFSSTKSLLSTTKRIVRSSTSRSQVISTSSRQAAFIPSSRRSVAPSPTSSTANTFTTSSFPLPTNFLTLISLSSHDSSFSFSASSSTSSTEAGQLSSTAATSASVVLSPSSSRPTNKRPTPSSTRTSLSTPEPSILISEANNNNSNSAAALRTKVIPSVICGTLLVAILLLLVVLYRRRRRAASLVPSTDPAPPMSQVVGSSGPGSSSASLLAAGVSPQHSRSSEQLGLALGGADIDPPSRATRVRRSFLAVLAAPRAHGTSATSGSSFGGGRSSYGHASGSDASLDRVVGGYNSQGGYLYDSFGAPGGPPHSPASGWTSTSSLQSPVLRTDGFPLPPSGAAMNDRFRSEEVGGESAQEVVEDGARGS